MPSDKDPGDWKRMLDKLGQRDGENQGKVVVPEQVDWETRLPHESATMGTEIFAFDGERQLGHAYLSDRAAGVAWIELLYVIPPARRQGLGAKILRSVESYCSAHGVREIQGEVSINDYTVTEEEVEETAAWFEERGFTRRKDGVAHWFISKAVQ
ncbi:GNAT family N-acetyltransferase [Myxococcus virescens]|uniref:GNAT family N-acetyltransferase n=1 Tax=Myxococcus TaxID=32 RepID=UPI001146E599|nr:GNAT family N-acetyltransferase [Myxococcus sp. AB056]